MESGSNENTTRPPKLKISDWLWIGLAVAIFVAVFLVILIYDVI
jgi:hypothetical protein